LRLSAESAAFNPPSELALKDFKPNEYKGPIQELDTKANRERGLTNPKTGTPLKEQLNPLTQSHSQTSCSESSRREPPNVALSAATQMKPDFPEWKIICMNYFD